MDLRVYRERCFRKVLRLENVPTVKKCRVDANARSEVGRRRCRRKGGGREGEERQRGVGTRLRRCRRARWWVGGVGCRLTERKMADLSVSACVSA